MKLYFLPIPTEPMYTIFDGDTKRKFVFKITTNPHEVPEKLGMFLVNTRPVLFGASIQHIRMCRGDVIPKKIVAKKSTGEPTKKSTKSKGGK